MNRMRLNILMLATVLITSLWPGDILRARAEEATPLEYRVKGAFLFNFAKFTYWPPAAFADSQAPFVICIAGKNPFGDEFRFALEKQAVLGRTVALKQWEQTGASGCHIVFISGHDGQIAGQILGAIGQAPVLTVGETVDFRKRGGAIQFVMDKGKVRFEISMMAVKRQGLTISSRLLSVAKEVDTE